VPKLVAVVKPLACLADLVTVAPTARHAINIEVGHGDGSHSPAFDLWGVRRQADAHRAPPGGPDDHSAASASAVIVNLSSLLALCIVTFWTLVIDAVVVALLLAVRGEAALPVFVARSILNGAAVLFLFQPLLLGSR
jgi:hypothetical protein